MRKTTSYRDQLRELDPWDSFLLEQSGLPGPRGNIELAREVADQGGERLFRWYLTYDAVKAPANSPEEFLAFCGVLGLGRLLAEGRKDVLVDLRRHASDPRWRTREAVAMALQRWGRADMEALLAEMVSWAEGNWLNRRAAAAALCEPDLLREPKHVDRVLEILDVITASVQGAGERTGDDFKALRKGLGYCWSVAAAAYPERGKRAMERWFGSDDKDVRWIMRENLTCISHRLSSRSGGEGGGCKACDRGPRRRIQGDTVRRPTERNTAATVVSADAAESR